MGWFDGLEQEYYGVEFVKNGKSILFPSTDLLEIVQRFVKLQIDNLKFQDFQMIENNIYAQFNCGYTPYNMRTWLALAEYIKQKDPNQADVKISPIVINCGGRKINIFNPSNRYTYDYGTYERLDIDIADSFNLAAGVDVFDSFINPSKEYVQERYAKDIKGFQGDKSKILLTNGNHPMYLKSTDALEYERRGLTYHYLLQRVKETNISDEQIIKMIRLLLIGAQPQHDGLQEMPKALPALVVALFGSEASRNPISFIPSLMLLDLIENKVTISFNGLPITLENCLKHPDYDLTQSQSADHNRNKKLMCVSGLHPMVHGGSFGEFKKNKYQLSNTTSNIKSAVIIIEWLTQYIKHYSEDEIYLNRVSKSEFEQKQQEQTQEQLRSPFYFECWSIIRDSISILIEGFCTTKNKFLPNNYEQRVDILEEEDEKFLCKPCISKDDFLEILPFFELQTASSANLEQEEIDEFKRKPDEVINKKRPNF